MHFPLKFYKIHQGVCNSGGPELQKWSEIRWKKKLHHHFRSFATNNVHSSRVIRNSKTILVASVSWPIQYETSMQEFWPRTIINIPIDNATWCWPGRPCLCTELLRWFIPAFLHLYDPGNTTIRSNQKDRKSFTSPRKTLHSGGYWKLTTFSGVLINFGEVSKVFKGSKKLKKVLLRSQN